MLCLSEINLVYTAFSELNFVYCKGLGLYIKKKWIKGRCEQFIHIFVQHCLKVLAFALVDVFYMMLISDIFADTTLNICILLYIYIYNMHFLAVIVPEIEMVTS